jgi:hypothetical protein
MTETAAPNAAPPTKLGVVGRAGACVEGGNLDRIFALLDREAKLTAQRQILRELGVAEDGIPSTD